MIVIRYIIFAAVCAAMAVGCNSVSERDSAAWKHFVDNSRVVRIAKRTHQLGHDLSNGTAVSWAGIASCLPNSKKPVCLDGGKLSPGKLGEEMKCSIHGQLIDSLSYDLRCR